MHILAEWIILTELQKLGIVKQDVDIDKALEAWLGFLFMPHGLGHLVGLDVHEVGGYLPHFPERSSKWGLKSLWTAWDLEENMCITIEPGLYFVEFLLNEKFDLGFKVSDYVNIELAL